MGIATSSRDRTVRSWFLEPFDERRFSSPRILLGHMSFVGPLTRISPNEEFPDGRILSGGMDMQVLVWDLRTSETARALKISQKLQSILISKFKRPGKGVVDGGEAPRLRAADLTHDE